MQNCLCVTTLILIMTSSLQVTTRSCSSISSPRRRAWLSQIPVLFSTTAACTSRKSPHTCLNLWYFTVRVSQMYFSSLNYTFYFLIGFSEWSLHVFLLEVLTQSHCVSNGKDIWKNMFLRINIMSSMKFVSFLKDCHCRIPESLNEPCHLPHAKSISLLMCWHFLQFRKDFLLSEMDATCIFSYLMSSKRKNVAKCDGWQI